MTILPGIPVIQICSRETSLSVQQLKEGQEMLGLELILIIVLQFEGTSGAYIHYLYHGSGENIVLPCESPPSSRSCSIDNWFYKKTPPEVNDGKVVQISPGPTRLFVQSKCALIIKDLTAEDAGYYTCGPASESINDDWFLLIVLTISPSSSAADPTKDAGVTLQCSLKTTLKSLSCSGSIQWLDEAGTKLTGEDDRYKINKISNCNSYLTVKHQNVTNRKYTCKYDEGNIKVEAHYTAVLKDIKREGVHIYHRAGDYAVLPCKRPSSSSSSCSTVNWLYRRDEDMNPQQEVQRGNVVQSSSKAARLSVDNNCSLIINSITAEDAGLYRCQIEDGGSSGPDVYLNLMSTSPVGCDPTQDKITLLCSLLRFSSLGSCLENSLLWVDETGTGLTGEGVGHQFRQTGCDSYLTVKLQSSSRRYTCQFIDGNTVKNEAHYQLEVFTAVPANNSTIIIIFLGAGIGVLLLLVVLAAVFIQCKKTRVTEERQITGSTHESHRYDEQPVNLTYASVKAFHPPNSTRKKIKHDEDTVTYSAVRTKRKKEDDCNLSGFNSYISDASLA